MTTVIHSSFRRNSRQALRDAQLQDTLTNCQGNFIGGREKAISTLGNFSAHRDRASRIRSASLQNLPGLLIAFEAKVKANGGEVHWAGNAIEAREIVVGLCKKAGASTVTKSKSMVAEEVGLNEALSRANIQPVETDLGEYIIQLRDEKPSHIIAPALHVSSVQVADDFRRLHADLDPDRDLSRPESLLAEARAHLRKMYLRAEVGITGANILVAETGSAVVVTNEGNADLTGSLPNTHIVLTSIEKVVATMEDAEGILTVLARSATGQSLSTYTTCFTGSRRQDDQDGPQKFHVVLLDNGRSRMLLTPFRDALKCIRCGACMNHCPVFFSVGGHAYGSVYPGPIGAVLTSGLSGLESGAELSEASTVCGRCDEVCPVKIPLTSLMRSWRCSGYTAGNKGLLLRCIYSIWRTLSTRPRLYSFIVRSGIRILHTLFGWGWALPAWIGGNRLSHQSGLVPEMGITFQALWARRSRDRHARRSGRS